MSKKYRYWCGTIISSDSFTYVKTFKTSDVTHYVINSDRKELIIYFNESCSSLDLESPFIEVIKEAELVEAEFELKNFAYINGIELYMSYNHDIKRVCQYLMTDDLGHNGIALTDDGTLGITLTKLLIESEFSEDLYLQLLKREDFVYPRKVGNIIFANYDFVDFDGKVLNSTDTYIYGVTQSYAVNSITNLAQFVRVLEDKYPDISIFVDSHDRDEKKTEWIQIRASLDEVSSGYHTIVHESPSRGRWSQSSAKIALEYTTNDIMLSLARRDQYLHGQFLNDIKVIEFKVGETNFGCSVFWERNDITTERPAEDTSHDEAGYRLFSFTINCILYFKIAEFVDRKLPTIATVILQIIESNSALMFDEIQLRPRDR